MSDLTLNDLRVFTGYQEDHPIGRGESIYVDATLADLIAVALTEGGQIASWHKDDWGVPMVGYFDDESMFDDPDARFLVLRFPEDTP